MCVCVCVSVRVCAVYEHVSYEEEDTCVCVSVRACVCVVPLDTYVIYKCVIYMHV